MISPKVAAVQPLDDKRLLVTFMTGDRKIYDCKRIVELEPFHLLRTEAFFRAVRVDEGGYGISWNDEMDLSEYELWQNGTGLHGEDPQNEVAEPSRQTQ